MRILLVSDAEEPFLPFATYDTIKECMEGMKITKDQVKQAVYRKRMIRKKYRIEHVEI